MASDVGLDELLERSPGVCGGRLRIAGTRVPVLQIVAFYKRGETAEEIADNYPHLPIAGIYAALAYYHQHQSEVEQELAEERAEAERLEQQYGTLGLP